VAAAGAALVLSVDIRVACRDGACGCSSK
jgi:hypothetical protein